MNEVYAHSIEGRPRSEWETMAEHEARTARLCRQFLRRINPALEPWGELLGRWHDLGKYSRAFQEKLRGECVHAQHSAVGAAHAAAMGKAALALSVAIAGHHTGLANVAGNDSDQFPFVRRTPLREQLREGKNLLQEILSTLPEGVRTLQLPQLPAWLRNLPPGDAAMRSYAFFTRVLFSVLVDADRLATAEFYAGSEGREPGHRSLEYDSIKTLKERLDNFIDQLAARAASDRLSPVNAMRAEVLAACRDSAAKRPGFFSLTVPTGGGKTLSAMSFALRHAFAHRLDRVIVVIPFTSIIEQNASRYREAFGAAGGLDERNVLEHHSAVDEHEADESDPESALRRRLAAENWDAPIIVTTSVQFFESLFSDLPSRCRKVHRIAKSVVILDEVQTLPPGLLLPVLDALKELTAHYSSTVVLSTATPPALVRRERFPWGLSDVRPIISDPIKLAASAGARRVHLTWRADRPTPYQELARELVTHRQVLAVVHRRRDARTLAEMLPAEGRFHLSALMCPAHRLAKIKEITRALQRGDVCRIVSTQLVEAGVDIDLPVVYRALAGLDSLAQSAGRCDREGRRTAAAGRPAGEFVVFRAETDPPHGTLRKALQSTETLLKLFQNAQSAKCLDPFNPEHCELFFRELYEKEDLDGRHVQREQAALNFANVGAAFHIIDEAWSQPVVVPWGEGQARAEKFQRDPRRATGRDLQPFIVQVTKQQAEELLRAGAVERWKGTNLHLPTALFGTRYSEEFGLACQLASAVDPELLMV
ncbi:MAG: CRISPR-associated endonuclease Cas3'' [Thermoguttaceae bacterium]